MANQDRRHSVEVARRFHAAAAGRDGAEMAGALLHDVGKVEAGLGTFGRVAATIVGPRTDRFRRYHDHEAIGAGLAAAAGADPVTVALIEGRGAGRRRPPRRRTTSDRHTGSRRDHATVVDDRPQQHPQRQPLQMPAMPHWPTSVDRADRGDDDEVAEGGVAEEPVVAGADEHAVVGEGDGGRQQHRGEEPHDRRRSVDHRRVGREQAGDERGEQRQHHGGHDPATRIESTATRRASSAGPRPAATAELLGDERLRRDGQGVEGEGDEQQQAGADLVGGERRRIGAGGDRRGPGEHDEHRADAQQQVLAGR